MIQVHHNFVDFDIEIENLPGSTIVYRAVPRIQDIDPQLRVVIAVQDEDNYPASEEEVEEDVLDMIYYQLIEDLFKIARNRND